MSAAGASIEAPIVAAGREEPADVRVEPVEDPLGVDAPEAERQDVAERGEQLLALLLVAALLELPALPRRVGQHQAAAVEHADEVLQLLDADGLRRELGLEPLGDVVEARLAVEHLQDGELFFLEAEVLQAHRVLHDPVDAALIALPPRLEIRPHADRELPRGTGDNAVGEGGHGQEAGLQACVDCDVEALTATSQPIATSHATASRRALRSRSGRIASAYARRRR